MKLRNAVCMACLCAYPLGLTAQTGPEAAREQAGIDRVAEPEESPGEPRRPGFPTWLRANLEVRGRAEWTLGAGEEEAGRAYLNRLRLKLTAQPARWLRFHFEGQDARAFSLGSGFDVEPLRNSFDMRQAYVETGVEEDGLQVRAGRQEFSVGDERLLGADGDWDPLGQAFDGAKVSYVRPWGKVEAFSGYRVAPGPRRLDTCDRASRIAGLVLRYEVKSRENVIEPYLLWKRGAGTLDLLSRPGHRDVATPGVRAAGPLARGLDYNVEMAFQRGHVVGDTISAWGGHWEIGWRPFAAGSGPRVAFEYNYASGDADPSDGRHETFDELYPAGFNVHGIVDPFAWRNVRYPAVWAEVPLTRRWVLTSAWTTYRLATVHDGLYTAGDEYLVRDEKARSGSLGWQAFVAAGYTLGTRWRFHAGFGHLRGGDYLRRCANMSASATVYVLSSYSF